MFTDLRIELPKEIACTVSRTVSPARPSRKSAGRPAAKAGLEKVTDFVEGKGVDGARASEALSALATADDAAAQANLERERALAAVKVDKADVDLVVQELEVDRAVADRELRVQGGDVVKALRALVNA